MNRKNIKSNTYSVNGTTVTIKSSTNGDSHVTSSISITEFHSPLPKKKSSTNVNSIVTSSANIPKVDFPLPKKKSSTNGNSNVKSSVNIPKVDTPLPKKKSSTNGYSNITSSVNILKVDTPLPKKIGLPSPTSNLPIVTALPPLPPNWRKRYEDTILSLATYKLFPVDPITPEYATIAALLDPARIVTAEQIVNPSLWSRFVNTRKEMLKSKSDDFELLSKLESNEEELLVSYQYSSNFQKNSNVAIVPYSDNMVLLFHCTRNPQNINDIILKGLDERMCNNRGGLLGKGIYFSDNPEKSMQYDGCGGIIFIFAVLLGDCLSLNKKILCDFVREPEKCPEQKRSFNDLCFDSIIARPGPVPVNEYVVYNRYQCCPLYKIVYSEANANKSSHAGFGNDDYVESRKFLPPFSWMSAKMPKPRLIGKCWPFFAKVIFQKMGVKEEDLQGTRCSLDYPSTSAKLDCLICSDGYDDTAKYWKVLDCSHKLCYVCYQKIYTSRTTMVSRVTHTFVKCPVCLYTSGIEIGTCPNGTMTVSYDSSPCEGYELFGSIVIKYHIDDGKYRLHRKTYLPNNVEGNEILDLLTIAWDRRVCFTVGTSVTSNKENAVVWNIHHKTSQSGGVSMYGYPDGTYFERVKLELKSYGIIKE